MEKLAECIFREEFAWHGGDKDGARGDVVGVSGRREHGLANTDVVYKLAVQGEKNKAVEDPAHEDVGVVAARETNSVGEREHVEAGLVAAGSSIDGQQNGEEEEDADNRD